ncbi:MAG: glycosyltransferase, partial [Nitrospina sp.]|nr:glycosyltransferase [Nitrospina sp.]
MEVLTVFQFIYILIIVAWLTVNMVHIVRVAPVAGPLKHAPRVSVCVPARNEERGIEACLTSLLQQDYPHFEVIAVDDNSTDGTGAIIDRLAAQDARLIAVKSPPLPEGWYGKPHALHQAVQRASGDLLVFTDADPVFEPSALASAVFTMETRKV